MKTTALYSRHVALGGKIIDFGGWALPVQYLGIIPEHEAVRENAGLFDVSHMGELVIEGPDAFNNLQMLVTNDLSKVEINQAIYSPVCTHEGGVVDDILLYRLSLQKWMMVVNAANTEKDEAWVRRHLTGDVKIMDASVDTAQLAVQGPKAAGILQQLTRTPLSEIRNYRFLPDVRVAGVKALVSRTGYTGEDGFEIYLASSDAPVLWDALMTAGKGAGLLPAGLGARDTLRFESALPLYGHELYPDISPLEAGLSRFVKLDKNRFIGREALIEQEKNGPARRRAGLEMIDRGIPRYPYAVSLDGREIGYVTSGSYAPTLKKNLAMALLPADCIKEGLIVDIVIRDRPLKAQVVRLPFYTRKPQS